MTDLWLPDVRIAAASPRLMDNTARFTSPLSGTMRTVSRPGDRWGVRLDYSNLFGFDRARMEAFIARMRGAANRVLWSPTDFPQRGSFPSAEKLLNNTFAAGTTGWTVGAGGTMSATDRRLRLTFNGAGQAFVEQNVSTLVANMPHVARYFLVDGKGTPLALGALQSYIEGTNVLLNATSFEGLNTLMLVPDSSSGNQIPLFPTAGALIPNGQIAGNYAEVVWTSLAQCALIDNGPNLLQFSDTLASPWSTSAASVAANAATAADGTTTAATITDTTSNVSHFLQQASIAVPSAIADFMICGEFKAGAQNFVFLQMTEASGGTSVTQYFNLNSGVLASTVTGTNWASARAFIRNLGNGWYYCCVVARKTNAATSLTASVGPSNSGSSSAYAGAGSVATDARRLTMSQSSVPARQVQSAGAQVPATAQTGSAYYIKGLPVSTAALSLPGDWIEVNKELKRITAQLDSDAAGLGYLQFSPPIRTSANDEDPVIFNMPMGRFILSNTTNGWQSEPGPNAQPFATNSLDLVEASS